MQCTSLYGGVQRLFRHSMTQINHLDLISLPLQWRATTSSLYLVSGVFSGNLGEMFIRLPLVLYSFRMSSLFASAAARNVSVNINQKIPCTFFFDRIYNIHLVIFIISNFCFFSDFFYIANYWIQQIISCIIFYKKLFKAQKMTDTYFPHFCKFYDTHKKNGYKVYILVVISFSLGILYQD